MIELASKTHKNDNNCLKIHETEQLLLLISLKNNKDVYQIDSTQTVFHQLYSNSKKGVYCFVCFSVTPTLYRSYCDIFNLIGGLGFQVPLRALFHVQKVPEQEHRRPVNLLGSSLTYNNTKVCKIYYVKRISNFIIVKL
jgi:hypothetical protein